MKKLLLLFLIVCAAQRSKAQHTLNGTNTTVYLVRHAEKETGIDPRLSEAGMRRAGDLYRLLRDKEIARVYATPYRRTNMTGDTMRVLGGIPVVPYAADTTAVGLLSAIRTNKDEGKTILVIGHSNTLLRMAAALGVEDLPTDIPDDEFDNIYTLHFTGAGPEFSAGKYGEPSVKAKPHD